MIFGILKTVAIHFRHSSPGTFLKAHINSEENLGTLLSGSAALMVAAQFWHGYGGGLYIAWFLPLLLLVIFRPNLQDRVATKVVAPRRGMTKQNLSGAEPEPA